MLVKAEAGLEFTRFHTEDNWDEVELVSLTDGQAREPRRNREPKNRAAHTARPKKVGFGGAGESPRWFRGGGGGLLDGFSGTWTEPHTAHSKRELAPEFSGQETML